MADKEEYIGMLATLELCADNGLKSKILAGKEESIDECVDIDEVKW